MSESVGDNISECLGDFVGISTSGATPVEIELIRKSPRSEIVAHTAEHYVLTRDVKVFKPVAATTSERMIELLRGAIPDLRAKYPGHDVVVHWSEEGTSRQRRTAITPVERAEALLERAMTSAVRLTGFDFPLASATDRIEVRLASRILGVLRTPS